MLIKISATYACLLIGLLIIKFTLGERIWFIGIFNNFWQWVLLPSFFLLILNIFANNRYTSLLLAIIVVFFMGLYGRLLVPKSTSLPQSSTTISFATFNTGQFHTYPSDVIDSIGWLDADVIALLELTPEHLSTIRNLSEYPYQIVYEDDMKLDHEHGQGVYGVPFHTKVLISRYPISDSEIVTFSSDHPYIRATIDYEGRELEVLVVHFPSPKYGLIHYDVPERLDEDINQIDQLVKKSTSIIVMGDFNFSDQSESYSHFQDIGLIDSMIESGWGFGTTWPVRRKGFKLFPLVRIDYIWHSSNLNSINTFVGNDFGSDHLPIRTELYFN